VPDTPNIVPGGSEVLRISSGFSWSRSSILGLIPLCTVSRQVRTPLGARVTAVTRTANLDLVRSIGADEAIDYTKEDFTRRREPWDVVFDIGVNRSFADLRRVLSPGGKVILCGAPSSIWLALSSLIKAQLMSRVGSRQVSYVTRIRQSDLLALKDLAEAGKLVPVIDRQYALAKVPEALRYLGRKQARGKVVIKVA
jgi:NADPH:quinone reductase-like Zn-dependent oxidoreductase